MRKSARGSRLVVLATVLALVGTLLTPGAAQAAPEAPDNLAPANDEAVGANPQLTWDAVPGATQYRVKVSTDNFVSTISNELTVNTTYTPKTELPTGTVYWSVASKDASGESSPTVATFVKTLAGPTQITPTDGDTLDFPEEPPTFSWSTLPSVKSYVLEIDNAEDFIGATKIVTSGTTFTLTDTQTLDQDWFWRVRGSSNTSGTGVLTEWSDTWDYQMAWDSPPVLTYPPNTTITPITDIELIWEPVAGAAEYQLQVNKAVDFTGQMMFDNEVVGTRFAPKQTYDNSSYHWRVRPIDEGGHLGPWSQTWSFRRDWPSAPSLTAPADGELSLDPISFSWSAIDHASHYELQVGDDEGFSPGSYSTCFTNQTTVMPYTFWSGSSSGTPGSCSSNVFDLAHGPTYYWRVRGIDADEDVLGIWSPVRDFIRRMDGPPRHDPTSTVTPVLSWDEVEGADEYLVRVYENDSTTLVDEATTRATTFTPIDALVPADGPFRWYVVPVTNGDVGVLPHSSTWSEFTVTTPPAAATPTPTGPADASTSIHMPAMTWTPVTDATDYEIWYSVQGSGIESLLTDDPENGGYTHPGAPLPEGTYEWYVKAFDGSTLLSEGSIRSFTIGGFDPVDLTAPAHCPPSGSCAAITSSPIFDWEPVDGARFYLVYLAFDPQFTNINRVWRTNQNEFIPREELPDNDAGQAYYWHVRPCKSDDPYRCSPDPQGITPASQAFQKRSSPVVLSSPGDGATAANQPRFTWQDYLTSNPSDLGAKEYRIQVSTVPSFASILDDNTVDQTYFTPYDETYPEGPLYWRVAAIDGGGNQLTWSTSRLLNKVSPGPTMEEPGNGEDVSAIPTFQWATQFYAEDYTLEVYKNGDLNFSPANKVLTKETAHTRYTPEDPFAVGTYAWRIRRDDADGRDGPWTSPGRTFDVTSAVAPSLISPVDDAVLEDDNIVFSWDEHPGAASYKFERSGTEQFTTVTETQTTVMTSWAPVVSYPEQHWYWRVHALDASGQTMGTSEIWHFERNNLDLPSIPLGVSATNSAGRVVVRWSPPASPGVPSYNGFVVILNPGNVIRNLSSSARSTTFNGLINGTAYDITVAAKNVDGTGPAALLTGFPNGCTGTPFSDVAANHAFCPEIAWLSGSGITEGSVQGDGTVLFKPEQAIARQGMAAFMYRFAGEPTVTLTQQAFIDVPPSHPFYNEIQWMAQEGLSTGTPNPNGLPYYKPNNGIARQGMAAFLHRYAGEPNVSIPQFFADVKPSHPFYEAIQWMADSGISTGKPQPTGKPLYDPNADVLRQAMAKFLYQFDLWLQ